MKFLKSIKKVIKTEKDAEKVTLKNIINNGSNGPYLILFIVMVLMASPIPVLSTIFGIINCIISYQLVVGNKNIKLPKFILNLSISKNILKTLIEKISPYILTIEKITKNRLIFITNQKFINLVILITSLLSISPVPFLSIFAIVANCLIIFGYINKDGIFIILGLISALINLSLQIAFLIIGKILFVKIIHLFKYIF